MNLKTCLVVAAFAAIFFSTQTVRADIIGPDANVEGAARLLAWVGLLAEILGLIIGSKCLVFLIRKRYKKLNASDSEVVAPTVKTGETIFEWSVVFFFLAFFLFVSPIPLILTVPNVETDWENWALLLALIAEILGLLTGIAGFAFRFVNFLIMKRYKKTSVSDADAVAPKVKPGENIFARAVAFFILAFLLACGQWATMTYAWKKGEENYRRRPRILRIEELEREPSLENVTTRDGINLQTKKSESTVSSKE